MFNLTCKYDLKMLKEYPTGVKLVIEMKHFMMFDKEKII